MGSLLRSLLTAVMTVSMLHVISSAVEPAENTSHSGWRQSIEEAEAAARDAGVPLLIHFQAWYCGPCRQMDAQVFEHADIQQALQQGIVSVQLDVTNYAHCSRLIAEFKPEVIYHLAGIAFVGLAGKSKEGVRGRDPMAIYVS